MAGSGKKSSYPGESKRQRPRTPEVLESREIQDLLLQLNSCFRLMVLLAVTTGLRRSELLALKWSDVDFSNMRLDVLRSIYATYWGLQDGSIAQAGATR